jgi:hypothetical protein
VRALGAAERGRSAAACVAERERSAAARRERGAAGQVIAIVS